MEVCQKKIGKQTLKKQRKDREQELLKRYRDGGVSHAYMPRPSSEPSEPSERPQSEQVN